jgi:hypothetical protein
MHALSQLWPLPLGFIAGLIAVPLVFRWLLLLLASVGKLPPNLGKASQRPEKVGLALAIGHPVPWLLLLLLGLGIPRIIESPDRGEWIWFLVGVFAAPGLNAVMVFLALRRARLRRRR